MLLLNNYAYHMHMTQGHSNMLNTICYKDYTFFCIMVLSGTYIIVHANNFVMYITKEMCVFISIYFIAVNYCT